MTAGIDGCVVRAGGLSARIAQGSDAGRYVAEVTLNTPHGPRRLLLGEDGGEFRTSLGAANAQTAGVAADGSVRLAAACGAWEAEGIIAADPGGGLRRTQTYRFRQACRAAVCPGFAVVDAADLRYTFPLRAVEMPLTSTPALRADASWALPVPFHCWHAGGVAAIYGIDRRVSGGTLDFRPPSGASPARAGVWFPDTWAQPPMQAQFYAPPEAPGLRDFAPGDTVTIHEVFGAAPVAPDADPLLEAIRLAAAALLDPPCLPGDAVAVAAGIAAFYPRCGLWEPDALGPGRGWFLNMWAATESDTPTRLDRGAGYYDLGWGEGNADEVIVAMVRHWRRTGETDLLPYVDEMTRGIERFRRGPADPACYYDRTDGRRFGDFLLNDHVWTHSVGHIGGQLLQAWEEAPDYPDAAVRETWRRTGLSIARFLAERQRPGGDLQDGFDAEDREINRTAHRIAARATVCGLWTLAARAAGDAGYLDCALRLARAAAPEIERGVFASQMVDAQTAPCIVTDGESTHYALEGLVPLYEATRDAGVLTLCRRCVAVAALWTYLYDIPTAYRGTARGGQVCRMPDFPLLFPGGTAKGVEPLLRLYRATGDPLFRLLAEEMCAFLCRYRIDAPGRPWDGGMVHAMNQHRATLWGPDELGQIDSGMSTANTLAALEAWIAASG